MSTQLRLRGGTTAEHSSFTGAEREVTVDTTLDTLVVHDGVTAGGIPLAKLSDVTSPPGSINASNINTTGGITAAGAISTTSTISATGDITTSGDFTATGEVNAPTIDLGGGWKITVAGGSLKFTYNGTAKFAVSTSGALTVSDNMTAYGSP